MQGELNLVAIARELLAIHEEFPYHLINAKNHSIADFEMETFVQMWGNTSGGFESMGGCAMTSQRTFVFLPVVDGEACQVYFGGAYAYSVPLTDMFLNDVRNRSIKGQKHRSVYFSKEG